MIRRPSSTLYPQPSVLALFFVLFVCFVSHTEAQVHNLKVVTDASPDYSDLRSLVYSATSRWETPEQKCWAMFYWNHIARRQTNPIMLHGMALTDPIRQFNDYGYTMCSTISGCEQSIWEAMGLKHRYWDISNHTVAEVFYDGRWHMYDNSLSALYTLCDGKTLAGVEDIGKDGACEKSGGKTERGHVAKYHCLTATSPHGFLIGADTARSLEEESRCFNPNGLKLRTYFYDWDAGHRYILNLRPNESYTRHYTSQGTSPGFYIPNDNGKDPELKNPRYKLRGNGQWSFKPSLGADWQTLIHSASNIAPANGGLSAQNAASGEVIYKITSANVTTSQIINASFAVKGKAIISVSTDNGLHWKDVWTNDKTGDVAATVSLVDDPTKPDPLFQITGSYESLVRITLADATLTSLDIQTITALNAKTQPRLNLGRNTIHVGAGEQTESTVFWPELQGGKYKQHIVEEKNITCAKEHPGYMGTLFQEKAGEEAYIVYRIDVPRDMKQVTYGGRFYNRAPKSHIDLLHSFDSGRTWTQSWTLTDIQQPWDVIHYETVAAPAGCRSVLVKYVMNSPAKGSGSCSIYAVRMEANYQPATPAGTFNPFTVTFNWSEPQEDRKLVKRSFTKRIEKLPATYTINTAGADHPVMESLTISTTDTTQDSGLSTQDSPKFVSFWETPGNNLAVGKPYTLSHPSETNWGAGDPDGKKLTDGVVGPPYSGGIAFSYGATWKPKTNPTITLDLGESKSCASFGLNANGYPWHDALRGQVTDQIQVLVSDDGKDFKPIGLLKTDLRWIDLAANHMWPDDEQLTGHTYRLVPTNPITTRYVQYKITSNRNICPTELEVLDTLKREPFDLKIALPKN